MRGVLEMNCAHVHLPRAFQVQLAVVNKQTFVGIALRHFERQLVDSLFGFSHAQITGAEKRLELPPQIELVDPALIQFERLIVDGRLQVLSGGGHIGEDRARTLAAGAVIISGLQHHLGTPLKVVRAGLRDGALLTLAAEQAAAAA